MQIDRRITNGLAWAGAVLVVAIPAADFVLRQAAPDEAPRVSVVTEEVVEAEASAVPEAERPAEEAAPVRQADPIVAANTTASPSSSSAADPVDRLLQSGRELPSYISGSNSAPAPAPAVVQPTPATATAPSAAPAPAPVAAQPAAPQTTTPVPAAPQQTAALPPKPAVTLPTPVSQRPPSVAQAPARPVPAAPLIVDEPVPNGVVTADDLADWESGPLSEFLAGRRGEGAPQPEPIYQDGGFFLDQAPDDLRQQQTFPRAYGEGFYYPFSQ